MLPVCFLCHLVHGRVELRWEKRRESIAWLVREVFHPSACCPLANPQSLSSPFQRRKIQRGEGQNWVRTFAPDREETAAKQYAAEVFNNARQYSLSSSLLFLCVYACASPSPLALSATLHLPQKLSPSPFAHEQPLLFPASSCSFTDACSFLSE